MELEKEMEALQLGSDGLPIQGDISSPHLWVAVWNNANIFIKLCLVIFTGGPGMGQGSVVRGLPFNYMLTDIW